MSSDYQQSEPKAPARDTSGELVDVVERDLEHPNPATREIDEVITPTSIKQKQQDAETLERQNAAVERELKR